jgi:hypothetical protein
MIEPLPSDILASLNPPATDRRKDRHAQPDRVRRPQRRKPVYRTPDAIARRNTARRERSREKWQAESWSHDETMRAYNELFPETSSTIQAFVPTYPKDADRFQNAEAQCMEDYTYAIDKLRTYEQILTDAEANPFAINLAGIRRYVEKLRAFCREHHDYQ